VSKVVLRNKYASVGNVLAGYAIWHQERMKKMELDLTRWNSTVVFMMMSSSPVSAYTCSDRTCSDRSVPSIFEERAATDAFSTPWRSNVAMLPRFRRIGGKILLQ
jgi:hypothetical protein